MSVIHCKIFPQSVIIPRNSPQVPYKASISLYQARYSFLISHVGLGSRICYTDSSRCTWHSRHKLLHPPNPSLNQGLQKPHFRCDLPPYLAMPSTHPKHQPDCSLSCTHLPATEYYSPIEGPLRDAYNPSPQLLPALIPCHTHFAEVNLITLGVALMLIYPREQQARW